ncbi:MAG: flippase-like domain-containing protein [Candidatus Aminicenantes bacterium]|nr:flippase-like domain-containing protein [Candidatus Aminicenantes bacterium]
MRKKILRISWIVGILIFVFLIYKIGLDRIWEYIKKLSWQKFLILFFLRFLYYVFRTMSWKIIFEKYERRLPFVHLLAARIAGDAISYLTPSAQLGGEPIRAMMVRSSNKRKSLASVIVDKTIEVLVMIFFIIIAVSIAVTRIPMPEEYKFIFIAFVVGAIAFALFLLFKQREGFFVWIINALRKIKIKFKFIERNMDKIREIDLHISSFYKNHRNIFLIVFLLHSLIFIFWTGEIYFALLFIGAPGTTYLNSFLILTLGGIIILLPTVPAVLGIYEMTYVTIFILLGLGADAGITLTLIRRILLLTWAGIGLLAIFKQQVRHKS